MSEQKKPQTFFEIIDSLYKKGLAEANSGKYDEAIAQYNAYKALNPDDNAVNAAIAATTQAQAWKDKPTRHRVDNMSALNTKYYEFAVCENPAVKNSLVFSSSREEANGKDRDKWYGEKFFDLFQAAMDNNGKWSIPTAIPGPANSEYSDGAACFDATGNMNTVWYKYTTICTN